MVGVFSGIQQQLNTISTTINSKTSKYCSWKTIRLLLNILRKKSALVKFRFGVGEFGFTNVREAGLVMNKAECKPSYTSQSVSVSVSDLASPWHCSDILVIISVDQASSQQLRTARSANITVFCLKSLKTRYSKAKMLLWSIPFFNFAWGSLNFCFCRYLAQAPLFMLQTEISDFLQISRVWLEIHSSMDFKAREAVALI